MLSESTISQCLAHESQGGFSNHIFLLGYLFAYQALSHGKSSVFQIVELYFTITQKIICFSSVPVSKQNLLHTLHRITCDSRHKLNVLDLLCFQIAFCLFRNITCLICLVLKLRHHTHLYDTGFSNNGTACVCSG